MIERTSKIYITRNREEDISIRGNNHEVYDYDGRNVLLKNAKVWYNNDGNYVEPTSHEEVECNMCIVM